MLPELRGVRDHFDRHGSPGEKSEADAGALSAQSEPGDGRHRGELEALVIECAAEKIQRGAGSIEQASLFVAAGLAKPFPSPRRTPLQLPQCLTAVFVAAAAQRNRNHALQFRSDHDRHGDVRRACRIGGVCAVAAGDATALAQGELRNFNEGRVSAGPFGPERHRVEAVGVLACEQDDAAGGSVDHLALQRQPRAGDVSDTA